MAIPTEKDVGDAIDFLQSTDEEAAVKRRAVEAQAYIIKKQKSAAYLHAEGTINERNAQAELDEDVQEAIENHLDAIEESEAIQNKRKTCALKIDVWRSMNANRRQGHV